MSKLRVLVLLACVVSLIGCTVPTTYSKSISVKKDADGKVLETVETETVVQAGGVGYPVRFEHIRGIQPEPWEQSGSGQGKSQFSRSK